MPSPDNSDLAELEPFLAAYLNRLGPGQRRRAMRKAMEALRRENARRIAANIQPDGSAMEPRKPRKRLASGKGRVRRAKKMFPRIKLARSMNLRAGEDEGSLGFEGMVGHTAAAHHFGKKDFVGRARNGKTVRTRYPRRRLLGFAGEDIAMLGDVVLALLEK
ncbi:phage virion morphogenesis protein [Novosphingobium sp. ES2-1]|uniref:phage virion morphogenesis protein n=1 Tax=Novosphingobium sp. ES2-1 TaxID=2780074 RepID=UPI0018814F97|nr:phage virion morphogenesis protein [Novosphingobium sp. ES2-1]QOV92616.1 phage virion morphogenesis protein [Novosphingobium sp. ES2-1]